MTKEEKQFRPIKSKDICEIYNLLNEEGLVSFPLTEEACNKLDSLVESINSKYFEREIYISKEEKVVTYLFFLIKNHPFVDGNKRTAILVFAILCSKNELRPNLGDFGLDSLAVFIEKQQTNRHQEFIKALSTLLFG